MVRLVTRSGALAARKSAAAVPTSGPTIWEQCEAVPDAAEGPQAFRPRRQHYHGRVGVRPGVGEPSPGLRQGPGSTRTSATRFLYSSAGSSFISLSDRSVWQIKQTCLFVSRALYTAVGHRYRTVAVRTRAA